MTLFWLWSMLVLLQSQNCAKLRDRYDAPKSEYDTYTSNYDSYYESVPNVESKSGGVPLHVTEVYSPEMDIAHKSWSSYDEPHSWSSYEEPHKSWSSYDEPNSFISSQGMKDEYDPHKYSTSDINSNLFDDFSHKNSENLQHKGRKYYGKHKDDYSSSPMQGNYQQLPYKSDNSHGTNLQSSSYEKHVCDKDSQYYTPNHPDCMMESNKCNSTSMNYMPNHPDCKKCDKNSIHYTPNHPECVLHCHDPCNMSCVDYNPDAEECKCTDPCNPKCENFDRCNAECDDFDADSPDCGCVDPCSEECGNFDPNNPDCNNGTRCMDPCREECENFDLNHPDCTNSTRCMDPCREECENFDPDDPDCISCMDPCMEECENFNPDDPECNKNMTSTGCSTMLIGINSTTCEINEEYQAITCGECPDTEIEIEDLTERCRSPTPDMIDCMARVGLVEKEGSTCKMFEFTFKRSTMSPKCRKPKVKYITYSVKSGPVYYKPQYQKQMKSSYVKSRPGVYVKGQHGKLAHRPNYRSPKKLFYTPKRMFTLLKRRF